MMFFSKQKTAYEMRIIDWSSDLCSSDLPAEADAVGRGQCDLPTQGVVGQRLLGQALAVVEGAGDAERAYVVAPAAEAVRLARRDLAVRIEDDDLESRAAMQRGRDRRARIAGGGDEVGARRCIVGAQLRQGFGAEARTIGKESWWAGWCLFVLISVVHVSLKKKS